MSRRRKTVLYFLFLGGFAYTFVYVEYFSQEYSPLQVLSDARSEAKRLLRFILLYQYHCNSTIQTANYSVWPICVESNAGINIEIKTSRIAYSIGPSSDGEFEKLLIKNLSFSVYIFSHNPLPSSEFLDHRTNNTHIYRTTIVPNDPADFTRNSYDTQTVNNLLKTLRHKHLDILKIDSIADNSRSHDILYYLVKDGTLKNVGQLHIVLRIDKADDDYLYSWYRTLYNLFHQAGFRLYHTTASDQLCLQVTLMESCVYYMSWIKDPGPRTFVLYPPALDGSQEFELERLTDYLDSSQSGCDHAEDVKMSGYMTLIACFDEVHRIPDKQCTFVIIRDKMKRYASRDIVIGARCNVVVLTGDDLTSADREVVELQSNGQKKSPSLPLLEMLERHLQYKTSNILYIDTPQTFWNLITSILNSVVLQFVYELIIDLHVINSHSNVPASNIRQMYSELMRIEAYGFNLFESRRTDAQNHKLQKNFNYAAACCHRLNYVKTRHVYINK